MLCQSSRAQHVSMASTKRMDWLYVVRNGLTDGQTAMARREYDSILGGKLHAGTSLGRVVARLPLFAMTISLLISKIIIMQSQKRFTPMYSTIMGFL